MSYSTSSQTVGPFFHDGLIRAEVPGNTLVSALGQRIRIEGRVLDGDGAGVPDALIEIWQANHAGRYKHPADTRTLPLDSDFLGFGRCATDANGGYCFDTVLPGAVPFGEFKIQDSGLRSAETGIEGVQQWQARHICVTVFARGLLNHLYTRIYFVDDPELAEDPILQLVPETRRGTLIAKHSGLRTQDSEDRTPRVYHFDIVLQGAGETVFFNF
jgi:protocatechuate 3,4-dioxygenase alpha subunit